MIECGNKWILLEYIIEITGYAGKGKTVTLIKTYYKLHSTERLRDIRNIRGVSYAGCSAVNFCVTGNCKYGIPGG